ncbi:MAG: hypothetical protein LBI41_03750 [Lactobacillales bacterium]|jgi:GH25 family lysozyme M1 (1,4-beta-N-acetylmuramidase)|nr:hypothetical protein [Lactobacillales bacterium]
MKKSKFMILSACLAGLMMPQVVHGHGQGYMGCSARNRPVPWGINLPLRRGATGEFPSSDTTRPRIDFIDIASYQGWMTQEDFNALARFGVRGVVIKLTQSTTYRNPEARKQIEYARKAGLVVSVYHFLNAFSDGVAQDEAEFFATVARELGLNGDTIVVNDVESDDGGALNAPNPTQVAKAFEQRLRELGYGRVIHYTYANAIQSGRMNPAELGGCNNMWIAHFPDNPLATDLLHTEYAAWQWGQVRFAGMSREAGVDVNVDYTGVFTGNAALSFAETGVPIYRVMNPTDKRHHFTMNSNERDNLVNEHGWIDEGIAFYTVNEHQGIPLYRLYNSNSGEHLFTINSFEKDNLVSKGWNDEGIACYVLPPSSSIGFDIFRLWNTDPKLQEHLFTSNSFEKDEVEKLQNWSYEDIAFRVLRLN